MQIERYGLYLVMTNPRVGYERCCEAAVERGVRYVQLRIKDGAHEDVLRIAKRLRDITHGTSTRLIINDSLSIAMQAQADGIHVGQDDMPLEQARRQWGQSSKVFGLSTHNEQQLALARTVEPSYVGVGPIFATPTKANPDPVVGLARAAEMVRTSRLTCVGIGGIDGSNLGSVVSSGIHNFAVVRYVCQSKDPGKRIDELMSIWRANLPSAGQGHNDDERRDAPPS